MIEISIAPLKFASRLVYTTQKAVLRVETALSLHLEMPTLTLSLQSAVLYFFTCNMPQPAHNMLAGFLCLWVWKGQLFTSLGDAQLCFVPVSCTEKQDFVVQNFQQKLESWALRVKPWKAARVQWRVKSLCLSLCQPDTSIHQLPTWLVICSENVGLESQNSNGS